VSLTARTTENISEEKWTLRGVLKKTVHVTEGEGFLRGIELPCSETLGADDLAPLNTFTTITTTTKTITITTTATTTTATTITTTATATTTIATTATIATLFL
jgi:hypothetical protein